MTLRGRFTVENTVDIGRPCRVFLDGAELRNVRECDTEEGWARCTAQDADGRFIVQGDEFAEIVIRGQITVKPIEATA